MRCATARRVDAISTGFSTGPRACAQRVSTRPSQKLQRVWGAKSTVGVLRSPRATPTPCGRASVKSVAVTWQVAHETVLVEERPVSLKSASPRRAARGSSATRFVGSAGTVGERRHRLDHLPLVAREAAVDQRLGRWRAGARETVDRRERGGR